MKQIFPLREARRSWAAPAASSLVAATLAAGLAACGTGPAGQAGERVGGVEQAVTACITLQRGPSLVTDATISKAAMRISFGGQTTLKVGKKDESLIRFDLSSIPPSAVISSATLKLRSQGDGGCDHDDNWDDDDDRCDRERHEHHSHEWHHDHGDHGSATIRVHRATRSWTEGGVTFASFNQSFDASIAGLFSISSASAQKSADVKSLVAAWVSVAMQNYGFLLESTSDRNTVFVSSESPRASLHPMLEVCYADFDDHCAPNPCQNGATCQNGADGYTCACAAGFTGANCETNIDDCAGAPCLNGGACTDGVNGYVCACALGYGGANCEIDLDDCSPNPCQNDGVCTDGVGTHHCTCPVGFTGADCETNIDDCTDEPCLNGGVCVDGVNGYLCACAAGYTGANCETNIDDCAVEPCLNGGTCVDGVASYACTCAPGFTGASCEINIDDCAGGPCLNGGTCIDGIESYSCVCAPGYEGTNCEVDIDDCAPSPCVNGGVCVDGVNRFTCQCTGGYSGAICQYLPPVCPSVFVSAPFFYYETSPATFGAYATIHMTASFTNTSNVDLSFSPDDEPQFWVYAGDDEYGDPILFFPVATVSQRPLGDVPSGGTFAYDVVFRLDGVPPSAITLAFRPVDSVLGTMDTSQARLDEVSFDCVLP